MTRDVGVDTTEHHGGHVHTTALYASDQELLGYVVPFVTAGLRSGEPTVVAWGQEHSALLRGSIPDHDGLVFLDGSSLYTRPSSAIKAARAMFSDLVAGGATRIRVTGEILSCGPTWPWWARFEAAINKLWDEFPLWTLCAYDTRAAPAPVIADVLATHPYLARPAGDHVVNHRFVPVEEFLTRSRAPWTDPLCSGIPLIERVDLLPAQARRAVSNAHRAGALPAALDADDLALVVTEAVTNGICHGRGPVQFRLWAGSGRVVVAVSDAGPGPTDAFAGLVPASHAPHGGFGLWMVHQLADYVSLDRGADGFTLHAAFEQRSGS